jgi:predicted NAD/FAD-dependent oxidoreductase
VRVAAVQRTGERWVVETESGERHRARGVVLTPPVPIVLALLDAGEVRLDPTDRAVLESLRYAPCLSGLFAFRGGVRLPAPGGVQQPDPRTSWIADNHHKGISPEVPVVTIHASPRASREQWDDADEAILGRLRKRLAPYLDDAAEEIGSRLDRWSHSLPLVVHDERRLFARGIPPLAVAGDAFGEPRMEGAALSGLSAAQAIESVLRSAT